MSKNVIVNGENYMGVSTIKIPTTDGGTALFRDADDVAVNKEIVEIAVGTFTVEVAAINSPVVKHGMTVKPDVAVVFPMHWHDTTDTNLAVAVSTQIAWASSGRRSVVDNTSFYAGSIDNTKITDTTIQFVGGGHMKFQPTYTNADGETAQQVYKWVALKFAE